MTRGIDPMTLPITRLGHLVEVWAFRNLEADREAYDKGKAAWWRAAAPRKALHPPRSPYYIKPRDLS